MKTRRIGGNIILPVNAPSVNAKLVVVELHDVSLIDAPSVVISSQQLLDIPIHPLGRISFSFLAPESNLQTSLTLRVHVSMAGDGIVSPGDFMTTASHQIANTGDRQQVELPVQLI
jgi:putative lipoprotein